MIYKKSLKGKMEKSKKKIAIGVVVLVLIIAIVVAVVLISNGGKKDENPNNVANNNTVSSNTTSNTVTNSHTTNNATVSNTTTNSNTTNITSNSATSSTTTNTNTNTVSSNTTSNNTTPNSTDFNGNYSYSQEVSGLYHRSDLTIKNQNENSIEFSISAAHGRDVDHVNIGELAGNATKIEVPESSKIPESTQCAYQFKEEKDGKTNVITFVFTAHRMFKYVTISEEYPNEINPYAGAGVFFQGEYEKN